MAWPTSLGLFKLGAGTAKQKPHPRNVLEMMAMGVTKAGTVKVELSDGYTPPPVPKILPPLTAQADWYRFGKYNEDQENNPGFEAAPRKIDQFDEDIASIRVLGKKYPNFPEVLDDIIPAYTKCILESIQEGRAERSQIVETFGDYYVFFFGERPAIYTYTGTLINSKNANWVADFKYYYDNFLRGTKCVELGAKLILTYGGRQVEGYMMDAAMNTQAAVEHGVSLTFRVVITEEIPLGFSDDFQYAVGNHGEYMEISIFKDMVDKVTPKQIDPAKDKANTEGKKAAQNNSNCTSTYGSKTAES
jgi:hypothetical protein